MIRNSRRAAVSRLRIGMLSVAALTALTPWLTGPAQAQSKEVKVALAVPLSGAWARNGELHLKGAQMAVEDINAAGGVKALGGAKLKLIVADAGDSAEKAKNAAQLLLSKDADLVGGTGAFLSSFTLAITEVTERAQVPWLTLSYSDQITQRGYKYVFQTSPIASKQAQDALPVLLQISKQANASTPKTVGIIMDNTASPVSFSKPIRAGGLDKLGLKLVVDEVFTPPLADASSMVQKVRNARPDLLLMLTTNVPDTKLVLEKLSEMGLGKGRLAVVANGGALGAPELLNVVGKDLMEGVMVIIANWGGKGNEKVVEQFKAKTKEPWMTQDSISTYGDMWILKDAMEMAKSADPKKVGAALHAMDGSQSSSRYFPGGKVKFDESGRRVGAELVILQWQNGEPKPIYPASLAVAKAAWAKK
jgi:branched-chain amino acid transport system substrate-binding protein